MDLNENNREIYSNGNMRSGSEDQNSKKRKIDDVAGEVIIQDTFKKTLISADTDDYVSNSNEVTFLRLESDPQTFGSKEYVFNPEFTNQVYNQEEEIKGYKNPEINIHLLGGSLHAFLDIRCKDKSPDADNIEHELKESTFLQGFLSKKEFLQQLEKEAQFKPFGEKIYEYELLEAPNHTYEIYHCKYTTEGFADYSERLQVFVKFFIDGASFIEQTDFWDYYILYQRNKQGVYTLCGYCTTYSFYLSANRKRVRISQFIILPPFQRKSHGSSILKVIYTQIIKDNECFELSVEDASMDFQHLRDLSDIRWCLSKGHFAWALKFCRTKPTFEEYKNLNITNQEIKNIQSELKLTKNQIKRVFEILKLAIGDMENPEFFVQYKNEIKKRLYAANRVAFFPFLKKKYPFILIDGENIQIGIDKFTNENMPKEEVEEKLQEYWQELYDQYNPILKKVDLILETMSC